MTAPLADDPDGWSGVERRAVRLGRNWVWEITSDRVYWSDELERVYGIDHKTFDGSSSSIAKLIHPDDLPKRERAIADALQGKKVEPFEYRVRRSDGGERIVLVKDLQLEESRGGQKRYLVGVLEDITELRQLEEQLRLLSTELESRVQARTAQLEKANVKLQELDRLKSMFIAMTSHELRTPLNSILGFISMTLNGLSGELNDEQKDNLSRAYGSAQHLLSLVTEVIDISKLEAGKTEAYPEALVLGELVEEAAGGVHPLISSKGLGLEIEVPSDLTLFTDRKRLLQCLINLLANAVKYTEAGRISVVARSCGSAVELAVRDTGVGIRGEELHRLFQPFERLDSRLRVKPGGTGLGLYLTRKLCTDILRGTISVQSREGEGSTFTMTIAKDIREAMP